jgi:DNA repair exonuclease SbcCD nuclease subunit
MKQTKFLISADWHLRGDKPRCRLDEDWKETQREILEFIFEIAFKNNANIIHTGDFFNSSHEPDWVKNMVLNIISRRKNIILFLLAGNHEIPYHNFEYINDSTFGVLWNMVNNSNIKSLEELGLCLHYGFPLSYNGNNNYDKVFVHKLTYKNNIPPFIKGAVTAQELLDIFKNSKYIITGDNHKRFIYENEGRYVINPGCIMRQTVDEINYDPSVYLIDFETEEIQTIKIPDKIEMVTDEYLVDKKKIDERIQSFVELVKDKKGLTLSFRDSLLKALEESDEDIDYFKDIVLEIMEEVYESNNREL